MVKKSTHTKTHTELSVPFFWPLNAACALGEGGMELFQKNLKFLAEAEKIDHGLQPVFSTDNTIVLELHTLRLRQYGNRGTGPATLVDAPFAGHSASIADYDKSQSLVQTLLANGHERVFLIDWKSATPEMKDYDIDHYLAEINVVVDDLGAPVHLIGLCQGGWMSAMYAARYPKKVASLVLAGSPIDTHAGAGSLKDTVNTLPPTFYEELVASGGGLMKGQFMLEGWKNMHPVEQYVEKYIDLYQHIDEPDYLRKKEVFERWYENPVDLPGRWYLQAINQLFRDNLFAKGEFVGLGKQLSLKNVTCPTYLLAGEEDDITPKEQVFAAEHLLGTPAKSIKKTLAPGGHVGLFMGSRTLKEYWPEIARWIKEAGEQK